MAKKPTRQVELFLPIYTPKDFHDALKVNRNSLICAEIYCDFVGACLALNRFFTTLKYDLSDRSIILLRVLADKMKELSRFHGHSEPFYMFIVNNRVTKVFKGTNVMKLEAVALKELALFKGQTSRKTYALDERTDDEMQWYSSIDAQNKKEMDLKLKRQLKKQSLRKRYRTELMTPHLQHLNFVLFWPHSRHAHPELYDKWNQNDITMVDRDEIQINPELAKNIFYAGDAPLNEASMAILCSEPALAICFKLFDKEQHFVSVVRRILYEEKELVEGQDVAKTAYNRYKTFSLSREKIWKNRKEERRRKKEEARFKKLRRLSEMRRLAVQEAEEDLQNRKMEWQQRKLALLKSGNLKALKDIEEEPSEIIMPNLPEEVVESDEGPSEPEDEDEYFPPPDLEIPGFYSPPNDIAKCNGLAILFPKIVSENVTPADEVLPPHVLVMMDISKRHATLKALQKYRKSIIHIGVFKATTPSDAEFITYSVKQFEQLENQDHTDVKIALMISMVTDYALLELISLQPDHLSRDETFGEEECDLLFAVDYGGDAVDEFEDFIEPEVVNGLDENILKELDKLVEEGANVAKTSTTASIPPTDVAVEPTLDEAVETAPEVTVKPASDVEPLSNVIVEPSQDVVGEPVNTQIEIQENAKNDSGVEPQLGGITEE